MSESRFFTDDDREAKLVEVTLSGEIKKCRTCKAKFVSYQLGDVVYSIDCPDCVRRKHVQEYQRVSSMQLSETTYLQRIRAEIDALDGIIWEQRWIPN